MRQIRIGEDVLGPAGERIGTVDRLVVDPTAHRITHLVVDGRLVGVGRLRAGAGSGDGLTTDLARADLEALPDVEHAHVSPAGDLWEAPPGFALEHFLAVASALIGQSPYRPPVEVDPDLAQVHEITAGSPVWAGADRLGDVDEVVSDDKGAIAELILREGRVFSGRKRLPASRVSEVVGNNIHVVLQPGEPESLPTAGEPE